MAIGKIDWGTIRKLKNGTEIDEPAKLITPTDLGTDQAGKPNNEKV